MFLQTTIQKTPFVSVVMPCLNEEESVGLCVAQALTSLITAGFEGEIIVVDNGSRDCSVQIAQSCGATVIHQPVRGYGSACLMGLRAAQGDILVMGDADSSYDFSEIPRLIAPLLRRESDIVLGSRFEGSIEPGAMPFLNRYLGNPALTLMLNHLFRMEVSDAHTGLRAFTRTAFEQMRLAASGMEFASEMLIQAKHCQLRLCEIPISYYPRRGNSKLIPIIDGWRHICFMLMHSYQQVSR